MQAFRTGMAFYKTGKYFPVEDLSFYAFRFYVQAGLWSPNGLFPVFFSDQAVTTVRIFEYFVPAGTIR